MVLVLRYYVRWAKELEMPQLNTNQAENFTVKRTKIEQHLNDDEISPLGKKLMQIALEVERSNEPSFDEADIEKELEKRRGGYLTYVR